MNEVNTVERPVSRPVPTREEFRALLDAHQEAGTCYLCGLPVIAGQAHHGATGAHWDCTRADNKKTDEAFAKVDQGLRTLGVKPRRKREGDGATAMKAKALAVAAIEEALGVPIYDVTTWNQQGVYRGPRWDLDAWGLSFWFHLDGHRFGGQASSLATMTQCVRYKKLKASREDVAHTFSLWEDNMTANAVAQREP